MLLSQIFEKHLGLSQGAKISSSSLNMYKIFCQSNKKDEVQNIHCVIVGSSGNRNKHIDIRSISGCGVSTPTFDVDDIKYDIGIHAPQNNDETECENQVVNKIPHEHDHKTYGGGNGNHDAEGHEEKSQQSENDDQKEGEVNTQQGETGILQLVKQESIHF